MAGCFSCGIIGHLKRDCPNQIRIYVGGISSQVTDEELTKLFGSSWKGGVPYANFGFMNVGISDRDKILAMNGTVLHGRRLRVEEAKNSRSGTPSLSSGYSSRMSVASGSETFRGTAGKPETPVVKQIPKPPAFKKIPPPPPERCTQVQMDEFKLRIEGFSEEVSARELVGVFRAERGEFVTNGKKTYAILVYRHAERAEGILELEAPKVRGKAVKIFTHGKWN